jgi:hypothetical protein
MRRISQQSHLDEDVYGFGHHPIISHMIEEALDFKAFIEPYL